MQKRLYFLFLTPAAFALGLFFSNEIQAQSGCTGCLVSLPTLPSDTIYISQAPDGIASQGYDGDISFRMPKTTTPVNAVDPGTPPGLNINKITIVSVVNVPPGLSWEPSQFEFDPGSQTDGCVKFCGTPLQSGYYDVQVFVTAEVLLVTQSTSFTFPMYIAPAVSNNDGFSMLNNSGCGAVTVGFENNIPSNGNAGYSYVWDFGNGNTSTAENPGPQTYTTPGQYEVSYQAAIDTFGYQLTTVQVLAAGCNDIGLPTSVPPDIYVKIKGPNGNLLVSTPAVSNVSFPFAVNINLMLGDGTYELEIRDDDVIGSESCGYVYFNKNTTDTLVSGSLKVKTSIIHPVTTVTSKDTITVFEIPEAPAIQPGTALEICTGEEIELEISNYADNLQWYRDTSVLFGETDWSLFVSTPGAYWAEYTSADGCKSQSDIVTLDLLPLPAPPAFFANFNQLELNDPSLLPANYSLQWFQDGALIPGATEEIYCITTPGTSLYTLQVTDNATGCTREFSIGATFNPGYNCATTGVDWTALDATLLISPNPTGGMVTVAFETAGSEALRFSLLDAVGRRVFDEKMQTPGGEFRHDFDLTGLSAGIYFLKIQIGNESIGRRIVKQG
jgi:hypothetical protein